ncbi:MAG: UDP-N-acetylmuramate dehydrogenase [Pseudoalteromonas sp.]|uniref:UDP-N-acetylmuramate dehydrogenase n=1 Tax=unclassified Pseudoalteromonas TaxID=194690 RepID=UPI003F991714
MAQSLQTFHTFSLPSQCLHLCEITDIKQLQQQLFNVPFCILGEGSNTVFLNDYQGTVIKMATKGVSLTPRENDYLLEVAAGENWHQLVTYTLEHDMPGLENLALIPGTVGAAPVQNIGAYGVELAKYIEYVECFDIAQKQVIRLSKVDCQFGYRDSIFKHDLKNKVVITQVGLCLPKKWQPELSYGPLKKVSKVTAKAVYEQVITTRNSKLPDPYVLANAGSFFKNPIIPNSQLHALLKSHPQLPHYFYDDAHHKIAAGWLIEQAGLKGHRIAGIEVYQQQALVLVNHGNSQGSDLVAMIKHIQLQVWQRYQIHLHHEVRLMADSDECNINLQEQP